MDTLAADQREIALSAIREVPFSIDDKIFEALIFYRQSLAKRRLELEFALEASIQELQEEESQIEELFGERLVEYASSALKGQRKKQLPTTSGVVQLRKLPDRLETSSESDQLKWALAHLPCSVRRKAIITEMNSGQYDALNELLDEGILRQSQVKFMTSVDLVKVRAHFKKTGEMPDGMNIIKGTHRLYMKERNGAILGTSKMETDQMALPTSIANARTSSGDSKESEPFQLHHDSGRDSRGRNKAVSSRDCDIVAALEECDD